MKVSRAKCKRGTVKVERIPLLNPEAALLLRKKGRNTSLLHKVVEVKTCLDKQANVLLKKAVVRKGRPSVNAAGLSPLPRRSPSSLPTYKTPPRSAMPALPSPRPAPPITPSSYSTAPMPALPRSGYAPPPSMVRPPPSVMVHPAMPSMRPPVRTPGPRIAPPRPPRPVQADTSAVEPYGVNGLGCGMDGLGCACPGGGLSCGCCK